MMDAAQIKAVAARLYQKHFTIDDDGVCHMEREDFEAALTEALEIVASKAVSDLYPEIKGKVPVVLYFDSRADADEFEALYKEAKPNVVTRQL